MSLDTQDLIIDGTRVATTEHFDVRNPATDEVFAKAPSATAHHVDLAMAAAHRAFTGWRIDDDERRTALVACADLLESRAEELTALLTAEQGKPLAEAAGEVMSGVVWLRWFAALEPPREIVQDDENGFVEVHNRPMGVVAAITPWNFPVGLAMWKIAPALRAGNTMVLKPSPYTPLTSLAFGSILQSALPPGVLNVVSGPDPLGAILTAHPSPRKISFTGSTATGRRVMSSAADDLKRVTLELGGNDPAIVLADVDAEQIADRLFGGAFLNNGQVCLAAKRVYVHASVHDSLVDALVARAEAATVGDGSTAGVTLGPLQNRPQLERVQGLVDDALHRGAKPATGASTLHRHGYFYRPTIVIDADASMPLVSEEQFGPALPIVRFTDLDDALAQANGTPFGLTASVWCEDLDLAESVAGRIDAGAVSINVHAGAIGPHLPFGGHKCSGIGVENGIWGLRSFTETQVIAGPARAR